MLHRRALGASLSPVGKPYLPYRTRRAALDANARPRGLYLLLRCARQIFRKRGGNRGRQDGTDGTHLSVGNIVS
jgi:hypothetical protein